MSFRAFRDAVIADIKANLVVSQDDPKRPFMQVAPSPSRIDETWLKHVSTRTPSVHIAFVGSAQRIERMPTAQLIGPWALVAHVIAGARGVIPAEAVLLDKLYELAFWLEGRNFSFPCAGPAMVAHIENLWDIKIDEEGYSIGAIAWHQDIAFGTDLAAQAFDAGGPMFPVDAPHGGLPPPNTLFVNGDQLFPDPEA
jgi:hypothetical protein